MKYQTFSIMQLMMEVVESKANFKPKVLAFASDVTAVTTVIRLFSRTTFFLLL
jgi:hypothetical protein